MDQFIHAVPDAKSHIYSTNLHFDKRRRRERERVRTVRDPLPSLSVSLSFSGATYSTSIDYWQFAQGILTEGDDSVQLTSLF